MVFATGFQLLSFPKSCQLPGCLMVFDGFWVPYPGVAVGLLGIKL